MPRGAGSAAAATLRGAVMDKIYYKGWKTRKICCVTQLNRACDEQPGCYYQVMSAALGLSGMGHRRAWVPHPKGSFPEKPGYSRLFYDWAFCPSTRTASEINPEATRLINQPGVQHLKGSRQLRPQESVIGQAWLLHARGVMQRCFTLREEHLDEVAECLREEMGEKYICHKLKGRIYVFPKFGSPEEYRDLLRRMDDKEEEVKRLGEEGIAKHVELYAYFPVDARVRWG
ncbi:hypothetical protein VQ02_07360 [Methylobacterium variabile]|uniref:Uncharacterized protein n=2 Tax=Methylobacterium variabile TaxID=298794 RepID=A0A0J6SZN4_9HYPH|nr:hypothetical protein VQ02_07360 [Methylobacterium variabile]